MGKIHRETWALDQVPKIIFDFAHLQKSSSDQFLLVRVKHFKVILNRCVIITLITMASQNTYFQIALELISFVPVRSISIIISAPWELFAILSLFISPPASSLNQSQMFF